MRHARTLVALAAGGVLAAGAAAPAAMAADDCPNAAVRAQQQSQHLPNCMAYEKVTPDAKGGALSSVVLQSSEENGSVFYTLNAGVEDAQGFVTGKYRASRSANGWTTNALMPAMDGQLPYLADGVGDPVAGTNSRALLRMRYPQNPNDQGVANAGGKSYSSDLYLREPDGSFTWMVPDPSVVDTASQDVSFVQASTDLDRIVVQTVRKFDSRVTGTTVQHLYVWSRQGMQLVSVLPDGQLPTAVTTIMQVGFDRQLPRMSADGKRVAFTATSAAGTGVYVRFNADDPATAETREVSVGPSGERCTAPAFTALSADGKHVIFECSQSLLPGAPANSFYLRDLDGGEGSVRLLGQTGVIAVNDDFSRIYTGSVGQGRDAITLWRDGVAEQAVPAPAVPTVSTNPRTEASVDGEYLAFESQSDYALPGIDSGGPSRMQTYVYSARTKGFRCVTCHQDGAPTDGDGRIAADTERAVPTPLSTRGTVVFRSDAALVPEDTNGVSDAYAWVDGEQVLLSGGRGSEVSLAEGASPDGQALYFSTADTLVPDDLDGGAYDIYAARVNGGWLAPEAPAAACTSGCQAPGPERPGLPGLGSVNAVGRGNLLEDATEPAKRATASLTASRLVRGKRTVVRVKVSRAGAIRVSGVGLRQTTVSAKKAGTYRVTVRLSAYGSAQQKKRGRWITTVTARFTPSSGAAVQVRKSVAFTAAKKGGR